MNLKKLLGSAKVLSSKVGNKGATIKTDSDLTIDEAAILQNAGLELTETSTERGDRVYKFKAI